MYNVEGGRWIKKHAGNVLGKRVLEFGNQHVWEHARDALGTSHKIARDWFIEMGVLEYVSIDTNKLDNAIPLDLTQEIPNKYNLQNRFDVVTNVGTIEHFENIPTRQWQAFYNAVSFCKIEGKILHQLVPENMWNDHCNIWYRDGIGEILAKYLGCDLIVEERITLHTLNPDVDYLCVALQRKEAIKFDCVPPMKFIEKLVFDV